MRVRHAGTAAALLRDNELRFRADARAILTALAVDEDGNVRVKGEIARSRRSASVGRCHAVLKSRNNACLLSICFRDLTAYSLH